MKKKVRKKKITKPSKLNKVEEGFIFDLCKWFSGKKRQITMPEGIRHENLFAHLKNNGCAGIYFTFLESGDFSVPNKLEELYRGEYFAITAKNKVLKQTAEKLDGICRKAKIDYVIIKGVALIESVYRQSGIRSLSDIDIIVETRDKALQLAGLLQGGTHLAPTVFGTKYKDEIHYVCQVYSEQFEQHVEVEIHFPLEESIMQSSELFFVISDRLFGQNLRMSQIYIPDPSAHFLILLFHLIHHHLGARLIWHLDIACLVNTCSEEMDWDWILSVCEWLEFKNILFHMLFLLKTKFEVDIPETIMEKAGHVPGFNNGILREMVSSGNIIMDSFGGGKMWQYPVVSVKRLKTVILYTLSPFLFNDKKSSRTGLKLNSNREKRIIRDEISIWLFRHAYTENKNIFKKVTVRFFGGLFSLISFNILVYYNFKNRHGLFNYES